MVEDLQIKHNEMIVEYEHPTIGKAKTTGFPVLFGDTPQKVYRSAPLLNQHTKEILKEFCNYNKEEVDAFITKNKS